MYKDFEIHPHVKYTVNVAIFLGRKFYENVGKSGGNFHDTTPISLIKACGFYFRVGVIFAKKTKARKYPRLQYATSTTQQAKLRDGMQIFDLTKWW